jgi:hypothetical protein
MQTSVMTCRYAELRTFKATVYSSVHTVMIESSHDLTRGLQYCTAYLRSNAKLHDHEASMQNMGYQDCSDQAVQRSYVYMYVM